MRSLCLPPFSGAFSFADRGRGSVPLSVNIFGSQGNKGRSPARGGNAGSHICRRRRLSLAQCVQVGHANAAPPRSVMNRGAGCAHPENTRLGSELELEDNLSQTPISPMSVRLRFSAVSALARSLPEATRQYGQPSEAELEQARAAAFRPPASSRFSRPAFCVSPSLWLNLPS